MSPKFEDPKPQNETAWVKGMSIICSSSGNESSENPISSVNQGSLLQVVAERELRLRLRLLLHLEGERAGVFWHLFPLVIVAASPVGLHPHPVHPIEARRGYSRYREC